MRPLRKGFIAVIAIRQLADHNDEKHFLEWTQTFNPEVSGFHKDSTL